MRVLSYVVSSRGIRKEDEFPDEVRVLCCVVYSQGIRMEDERIEAVRNLPELQSVHTRHSGFSAK